MRFIFHTVVGYPSLEASVGLAKLLDESESNPAFLELQIPFADPIADGPVITSCCCAALDKGATVAGILATITRIASSTNARCIPVAYYNTLLAYGIDLFLDWASAAGIYGLIVPDYTIDNEPDEFLQLRCRQRGLNLIQLVTPTTPPERLERIRAVASGFIYCTSRDGITGKEAVIDDVLRERIVFYKSFFGLPVGVGFGIRTPQQVRQLHDVADYVIIGSFIAERVSPDNADFCELRNYLETLRPSTRD